LLPLADGSVLAVGAAPATAQAWIYRPQLLGPSSGKVTVAPGTTTTVLTAPDPNSVTRTSGWQLAATDGLARALVAGPRMDTGTLQATLHVRVGGFALIAQQQGPGSALVAELVPGEKARLVRLEAGQVHALCTGAVVPAFDPNLAVGARLQITGGTARVALDDGELLACDASGAQRGAWGVGAFGVGARVVVDSVTLAR